MSTVEGFEVHTGDFFGFENLLDDEQRALVVRVRSFLDREVVPIANECWERAEFPFQVVDGLRELDIAGLMYGLSAHKPSRLLSGFLALEICRADPSVNTFYGVHTGLAMGSVQRCGSD